MAEPGAKAPVWVEDRTLEHPRGGYYKCPDCGYASARERFVWQHMEKAAKDPSVHLKPEAGLGGPVGRFGYRAGGPPGNVAGERSPGMAEPAPGSATVMTVASRQDGRVPVVTITLMAEDEFELVEIGYGRDLNLVLSAGKIEVVDERPTKSKTT